MEGQILTNLGPALPAAPLERRKLTLAPRSANSPSTDSPKIDSPTTRSSIFGGAKPIDSAAKEEAVAEKLKNQASERRQAAQKARDEEERKVKAFAEEREKMIKDALAGAGVPTTPAPEQQRAPNGGGERGGRGGARGGRGGPGRQYSNDRPPRPQGQQQQQQHQAPAAPRQKDPSGPVYDADGFEIAKGKGSAPPAQSPSTSMGPGAGQPRKEVKKGFSFSAAVAQGGFADDGEESAKKGSNGDSNGVEEVTKGVEDVTV